MKGKIQCGEYKTSMKFASVDGRRLVGELYSSGYLWFFINKSQVSQCHN
jgi:hypothetical protein